MSTTAQPSSEPIWGEPAKKPRNHLECYYCGFVHPHVEAGGVWACPNVLCKGPGASWFRVRRKTYKECNDGSHRHTVDSDEMIQAAYEYIAKSDGLDPPIRQKILDSVKEWQ